MFLLREQSTYSKILILRKEYIDNCVVHFRKPEYIVSDSSSPLYFFLYPPIF